MKTTSAVREAHDHVAAGTGVVTEARLPMVAGSDVKPVVAIENTQSFTSRGSHGLGAGERQHSNAGEIHTLCCMNDCAVGHHIQAPCIVIL